MSSYRELKKAYLRELVQVGSLKGAYESVPGHLKEKWGKLLIRPGIPRLQEHPRLINRFKIGADPEFIFVNKVPDISYETGRRYRVDAASEGLKTGLAFGADQNGRLIELRPKPSRSCLEVLASLWSELKWMGRFYPNTLSFEWQCGAFLFGDGIGGHIHFGRKRPTRTEEVTALDKVGGLMYTLGLFPKGEWMQRQEGDERGQRYGRYGDFRPQIHGYEYRTLPSWLDSPVLAYLCMVLAKLAVYDPKLVEKWGKDPNHIKHLLGFYQGLDDDAAIALKALEVHGLPRHLGGDFKGRWGIDKLEAVSGITVIPGSIAAASVEIGDLFDFLTKKSTLVAKSVEPTWAPLTVPEGFSTILDRTEVTRVAGMGEILTGLCDLRNLDIEVYAAGETRGLNISPGLIALLEPKWEAKLKAFAPDITITPRGSGRAIGIGDSWRNVRRIQLTKKLLTCGVFPIWKIGSITPETPKEWKVQPREASAATRTRVIHQTVAGVQ